MKFKYYSQISNKDFRSLFKGCPIILPEQQKVEKINKYNIFLSDYGLKNIMDFNYFKYKTKIIKRNNIIINWLFALMVGFLCLMQHWNLVLFGIFYIIFDALTYMHNNLHLYLIPNLMNIYYNKIEYLEKRKNRLKKYNNFYIEFEDKLNNGINGTVYKDTWRAFNEVKAVVDFIEQEENSIKEIEENIIKKSLEESNKGINESSQEVEIIKDIINKLKWYDDKLNDNELNKDNENSEKEISISINLILVAFNKILNSEIASKKLNQAPNKLYIYSEEFIGNLRKYITFDNEGKNKYRNMLCEVGNNLACYVDNVRMKLNMKDELDLEVSLEVLREQLNDKFNEK